MTVWPGAALLRSETRRARGEAPSDGPRFSGPDQDSSLYHGRAKFPHREALPVANWTSGGCICDALCGLAAYVMAAVQCRWAVDARDS